MINIIDVWFGAFSIPLVSTLCSTIVMIMRSNTKKCFILFTLINDLSNYRQRTHKRGGKGFGKCERKEERNERIGGGENKGGERIRKEEKDEDK